MKRQLIVVLGVLCLVGCGLSKEEQEKNLVTVSDAVLKNIEAFTGCYSSAQAKDEALKGKIGFKVVVQADGKATGATLTMNELGDEVGKCFLDTLGGMGFPAVTAPTPYEESFCFDADPKGTVCRK